jgi:hypothetical protein
MGSRHANQSRAPSPAPRRTTPTPMVSPSQSPASLIKEVKGGQNQNRRPSTTTNSANRHFSLGVINGRLICDLLLSLPLKCVPMVTSQVGIAPGYTSTASGRIIGRRFVC